MLLGSEGFKSGGWGGQRSRGVWIEGRVGTGELGGLGSVGVRGWVREVGVGRIGVS